MFFPTSTAQLYRSLLLFLWWRSVWQRKWWIRHRWGCGWRLIVPQVIYLSTHYSDILFILSAKCLHICCSECTWLFVNMKLRNEPLHVFFLFCCVYSHVLLLKITWIQVFRIRLLTLYLLKFMCHLICTKLIQWAHLASVIFYKKIKVRLWIDNSVSCENNWHVSQHGWYVCSCAFDMIFSEPKPLLLSNDFPRPPFWV